MFNLKVCVGEKSNGELIFAENIKITIIDPTDIYCLTYDVENQTYEIEEGWCIELGSLAQIAQIIVKDYQEQIKK